MDATHRAGWQTASPYLDTALDLPPEERAAWLAGIRAQTPALADLIEVWLVECDAIEQHDFLNDAAPVEPTRATLAGVQLGPWRLVSPIGHGGMGTVWLAERTDGRFEGRVAVKLLNASLVGRSGGDRFAREGRILARLAHPQIAHLIDAGVSDIGQPYLVLEYVEGEPIDVYCDRLRLSVADRVELLIELMRPVAHAHANLVVHRDLKPSNVLVTREGRIKLLDFGIARLLDADTPEGSDAAAPLTRAGDALLTPAYAAPEQVTSGHVSTATDVYALGVLAYVILTGRHPAGPALDNPAALMRAITEDEPPRLSDTARHDEPAGTAVARAAARATSPARLRQQLAGDLDVIVAKALKKAPGERYVSVEAFATDLQRHLRTEPIGARGDAVLYRAAKFVRRHRWPLVATAAAMVALIVMQISSDRARRAADRRFGQLRGLSAQVFALDSKLSYAPGTVEAREALVAMSLQYLSGLSADAQNDRALLLDVIDQYVRVAEIQGIPIRPSLGKLDDAEKTLATAHDLVERVLATHTDARALELSARIHMSRMIVADTQRRREDTNRFLDGAIARVNALLARADLTLAQRHGAGSVLANLPLAANNLHRYDDGVRLARQFIQLAPSADMYPDELANVQSTLANALRMRGDLDDALAAIREANATHAGADTGDPRTAMNAYGLRYREGLILGEDGGVSLERPDEAAAAFRAAFTSMNGLALADAKNATAATRTAQAGRELADILRWEHPAEALAIYDTGLQRLSERTDSATIKRSTAEILANSSYALRRLGRAAEADARVTRALALLTAIGELPAERIVLDSALNAALMAQADAVAARGHAQEAVGLYRALLDGVMRGEPDVEHDLILANRLAAVQAALAAAEREAGNAVAAQELEERRRALWEGWSRRLPDNQFVARRLASPPAVLR